MAADQEYFSVREVAERLGVSKDTIWRRLRNGDLPYQRVGRAVRIKWADVEEYLNKTRK